MASKEKIALKKSIVTVEKKNVLRISQKLIKFEQREKDNKIYKRIIVHISAAKDQCPEKE